MALKTVEILEKADDAVTRLDNLAYELGRLARQSGKESCYIAEQAFRDAENLVAAAERILTNRLRMPLC